ncbi:thiosulfate/3-mercaptopyruvate sulfurtransferase [Deinobacterium chartae]|uniref:Thiosulfate/3-mercaptopyruvate sulfurtransferase n=1 Tax=Deinobacterium chartae TaxID=521158 RepID=A0A841HZG9_9DEIO|nr:sulfurtransferase [Deinobacterium chartae]MBB6097135.1 thiosulfate/3-mercaptopyruvate sulfurtransferase [Deinobacterium chartae]
MAKNWISPQDLHARLEDPDLRIFDVRADLMDHGLGRRSYLEGHLPGAQFLDLETDLSGPRGVHGGRHPLPDPERLAVRLGELGVSECSDVVVYDASGGSFAARAWWLLRYLGHDRVRLLDGGLPAWQQAGYALTTDIPTPAPARFVARPRPELLASLEEVRAAGHDPQVALIDARAPERYRGEVEPIDPRAGHIPGAINRPFAANLEAGRFRSEATLRARFADLEDYRDRIVYCGSGVTAAHNLAVLDELGISARLYAGSFSDWASHPELEVRAGAE